MKNNPPKYLITPLVLSLLFVCMVSTGCISSLSQPANDQFDGDRAFQDVITQMEFGPRTVGSDAHTKVVEYIQDELSAHDWAVELQETTRMDHPIRNIIGKRGSDTPWIILGAHYDSRLQADKDQNLGLKGEPVPGANDGASGVAVLLELGRVLPKDLPGQVWLVFFDAEDNGNLPGWDWILGSRAFVESLEGIPDAAIVVDMIGDADLNIYQEKNSDPNLTAAIWNTAQSLGYEESFIPETKYAILDDHIPFLRAGIPAADLIDFDYPYHHTSRDTADKVSPVSLKIVGDTLFKWILEMP